MSQVHYRTISLAELVESSELVLVVKTAKPGQQQIQVPIGKDPKGHEAPAFVRGQSRCEVQSALSTAGAELVGKTLAIDSAHWEESLSIHKAYYLEGIGESPIYDRYQAVPPLSESEMKEAPFIAFLRRDGKGGYAFVVDGATERLKHRAAIEKLLLKRK